MTTLAAPMTLPYLASRPPPDHFISGSIDPPEDPLETIDPLDREDPLAVIADDDPRQGTALGREQILDEAAEQFREAFPEAYQEPPQPDGAPLTEQSTRAERLRAYQRRAGRKGIERSIRHPGDPKPRREG